MLVIIGNALLLAGGEFCLCLFTILICRQWPKSRNLVSFLVACLSAYSASFVFDMIVKACIGDIPYGNIIAPVINWLSIACISFYIADYVATKKLVIIAPFIIVALLAISVVKVHAYNFLVAAFILLIAVIIGIYKRSNTGNISPIAEGEQPKTF
jgi:hypothetical protein